MCSHERLKVNVFFSYKVDVATSEGGKQENNEEEDEVVVVPDVEAPLDIVDEDNPPQQLGVPDRTTAKSSGISILSFGTEKQDTSPRRRSVRSFWDEVWKMSAKRFEEAW